MNEVELKKLYDSLSVKFNIGTWDEFKSKMQTIGQRQRFYNQISVRFNIGSYENFEKRLTTNPTTTNQTQNTTQPQTSTTQQPTKIDPTKVSQNFGCILKNNLWKTIIQSTNDPNHLMYTVNNITGKEFHFYDDGKFMYNDIKPFISNIMGKWECNGDSNFIVKTEDGSMFDSKVNKWSYNVNESKILKKIVYKNLKRYSQ